MDRLAMISSHATSAPVASHPLDPLGPGEIKAVVNIVKKAFPGKSIAFNTVTLKEPARDKLLAWQQRPSVLNVPDREAFFVILESGVNGIIEGNVSLTHNKLLDSKVMADVQPILTVEDLSGAEDVIRNDPNVIEQCRISGVGADEMHKVYCDPWTISYDERWGSKRRLQQALMYFRSDEDDSQYSHPFDFCPIIDTEKRVVIHIDVPSVRRPIRRHLPNSNFNPKDIAKATGYREVKPINVTQPEGVNFKLNGRVMEWQNFNFHVGFNYREGIVLSNIAYNDHGNNRSIFNRLSLVDMVVPYGNPEEWHFRKHAIDSSEYGAGMMSNPLTVGCDCKGAIQYLDGHFVDRKGDPLTVKNAICIHEEDDGVLFKHSDFRDEFATSIVTRSTKLIISQIFTAANYEYMVYWVFRQDGSIALEVKLTGILNTFAIGEGEDTKGWGTEVYPGVNAHNHQHLFSLRVEPAVDGQANSVAMADSEQSPYPVGHPENRYGNGFRPRRTVFKTAGESQTNYDGTVSRTWDFFNPNSINDYSGKPASYKLVSRECPPMLPKEGSLVWKRAPFARNHMQVVPLKDDGVYPAGVHVPQSSGNPSQGLPQWIGDGSASIENTQVVAYHTFGLTHFPAPEDFPVMPAEPIQLMFRPRNFFLQNPALDVPPSHAMTTSEARASSNREIKSMTDKSSTIVSSSSTSGSGGSCCSMNNTAAEVKLCHCTARSLECNCPPTCACK